MSKILIIDDEEIFLASMSFLLTSAGHSVRTSITADGGLDLAETQMPEILIVDWNLRGDRNGVQIAGILKKQFPGLAVIAMTGCAADELEHDSQGTFSNILEKPFEMSELVFALHEAVAIAGKEEGGAHREGAIHPLA